SRTPFWQVEAPASGSTTCGPPSGPDGMRLGGSFVQASAISEQHTSRWRSEEQLMGSSPDAVETSSSGKERAQREPAVGSRRRRASVTTAATARRSKAPVEVPRDAEAEQPFGGGGGVPPASAAPPSPVSMLPSGMTEPAVGGMVNAPKRYSLLEL